MFMSAPSATPNLLFGDTAPGAAQVPAFQGEQRTKALTFLASAVAEQRVMAVMQLVNKDPSLVFKSVSMPLKSCGSSGHAVEFPLACLRNGISTGYLFAISRGFAVDTPLQQETTTLLQEALSLGGKGRALEADVSLLLSMGASANAMTSKEPLYSVLADAFPAKSKTHNGGAVAMLLDARVDFTYPDSFMCPYSVLLATGGWDVPESASSLTRIMAKFVKTGLSIERSTGTPRQTPLMRALGSKNGEALAALVRLGADSSPERLNGKDLFTLMHAQGLEQFKPLVQAALMESRISQMARTPDAAAAISGALPPAGAPVSRRRLRAV